MDHLFIPIVATLLSVVLYIEELVEKEPRVLRVAVYLWALALASIYLMS